MTVRLSRISPDYDIDECSTHALSPPRDLSNISILPDRLQIQISPPLGTTDTPAFTLISRSETRPQLSSPADVQVYDTLPVGLVSVRCVRCCFELSDSLSFQRSFLGIGRVWDGF